MYLYTHVVYLHLFCCHLRPFASACLVCPSQPCRLIARPEQQQVASGATHNALISCNPPLSQHLQVKQTVSSDAVHVDFKSCQIDM